MCCVGTKTLQGGITSPKNKPSCTQSYSCNEHSLYALVDQILVGVR